MKSNGLDATFTRTLRSGFASLTKAPARLAQTAQHVVRMPVIAVMKSRAAAHEAYTQWSGILLSERPTAKPTPAAAGRRSAPPPIRLVARPLGDGLHLSRARPFTARDQQVQADRQFLGDHRGALASGTSWAMRGRDGKLHLMPHSSRAADMLQAVDRSMRVEGGRDSSDYLQGGAEGAAASLTGTIDSLVGLGRLSLKTVTTDPRTTLDKAAAALRNSKAGQVAVAFSRNSTGMVAGRAQQILLQVEKAHENPRSAGRLHGQVGTEILQSSMPPWATVGMWAVTRRAKQVVEAADTGNDLVKGVVTAAETVAEVPVAKAPRTTWTNRVVPTGGRITAYADRAAARAALDGPQQAAANKFFKGANPTQSKDFNVVDLGEGNYRLEFFTPARNEGYGKLYVQEIGPNGEKLREWKDTMGPDGVIETKWLQGGPDL